jgi:cardiolipin synthase
MATALLAVLAAAVGLTSCLRVPPPVLLPAPGLSPSSLPATLEIRAAAPRTRGNAVEVLLNGEQIFPAMLEAVRSARRTITLAHYAYQAGPVARELTRALGERCRAGVGAKILLDGFGSRNIPAEYVEAMRGDGCQVAFFRPLTDVLAANYRNHRRIVVIDGRLGFTGGAGIGPKWRGDGDVEGHWRETSVRVQGPAVEYLQRAFAENWLEATGDRLGAEYYPASPDMPGDVSAQVITGSPLAGDFDIYTMFLLAVESARHSIHITNPYFLPDEALRQALARAVGRGVRVVLLAPGPIDWALARHASRAGFGRLLRQGVEIYEYTPALLHAKTLVVDGLWSTVGSANVDNRSFALNAELNLAMLDAGVARQLEHVFADDLARSRKVDYIRWQSRGVLGRFLEWLAVPLRPLL